MMENRHYWDLRLRKKSKLDPSEFFEMIDKVLEKYPHVKIVAITL
jgi:hypothetical protein